MGSAEAQTPDNQRIIAAAAIDGTESRRTRALST